MKDVKKWAKHIIRRFGKKNAMIYVNSVGSCPCIILGKECNKCWRTIFRRRALRLTSRIGCGAADRFFRMWRNDYFYILNVKKIIRRMIQ